MKMHPFFKQCVKFYLGLAILGLVQFSAHAGTSYDKYPAPKKGGNLNLTISINPGNLSPILQSDIESRRIADQFYMSLRGSDGQTNLPIPGLAEKVEVSKDKKDYTYTLFSIAQWSDGTPVTTDDLEFSFKTLMDSKTDSAALRGFFAGISFQKIDQLKFKFHVDDPRFNTLEVLDNYFRPFQKKQFANETDFNKSKEHLHPVGTGPWRVKVFSRDQQIVLERLPNWWAKDLPQWKALYNQDTWTFKVMPDPSLAYEKFIKGDIDLDVFTGDQYVNQVKKGDQDKIGASPADGKKVWGNKLPTDGPMGWAGIALNNKVPMLASVKTRQGLAYLVDYKTIYERVYFGLIDQAVSPFGSNTENTDPALRAKKGVYVYDPSKADSLFKSDGWSKEAGQPFLMKTIDGKKVPFHVMLKFPASSPTSSKTAVILKEGFKKNGIDLELRAMDTTALYKDLDDKQFEAAIMGWGGGSLNPDPKQLWSTESSANGGSNFVSYSNPKVDELITKANLEFDHKKRVKLLQQINRMIYSDTPWVFLAERHFVLQGVNSRFQSPVWLEKYGDEAAKELFHE